MLTGGVLRDGAMNEMADPDEQDAVTAPGGNSNPQPPGKPPKNKKEKKEKTLEQKAQSVLFSVQVSLCLKTFF